jgi:malate dehydrogenase (quinone)
MSEHPCTDVALVGGGIMSATLGSLMKVLMPDLTIRVFERLPSIAFESSQSMNNAGTGHAGNCELNYTPEEAVGSVDIRKALKINAAFEVSLQFWTRSLSE